MEKKKRDLRSKPIIVEYDGQVKEYASAKDFCEKEGFAYSTVLLWIKGAVKPSIDIKITKVERRQRL